MSESCDIFENLPDIFKWSELFYCGPEPNDPRTGTSSQTGGWEPLFYGAPDGLSWQTKDSVWVTDLVYDQYVNNSSITPYLY